MQGPRLPANEDERLRTLQELRILDTTSEERFDRYTRMAATLFRVPIALISLVDEHRQWFKSRVGLDAEETGIICFYDASYVLIARRFAFR